MLPLGGAWSGHCHALPGEPWQPDSADLERRCNLGYARGVCARFPDDEGADAIRFTIASDDGTVIRLYYAAERDHHPFAHGPLEYSRVAARITSPAVTDQLLQAQAEAYAASFLRRKSEAMSTGSSSR
jgi:hypothetical protein